MNLAVTHVLAQHKWKIDRKLGVNVLGFYWLTEIQSNQTVCYMGCEDEESICLVSINIGFVVKDCLKSLKKRQVELKTKIILIRLHLETGCLSLQRYRFKVAFSGRFCYSYGRPVDSFCILYSFWETPGLSRRVGMSETCLA